MDRKALGEYTVDQTTFCFYTTTPITDLLNMPMILSLITRRIDKLRNILLQSVSPITVIFESETENPDLTTIYNSNKTTKGKVINKNILLGKKEIHIFIDFFIRENITSPKNIEEFKKTINYSKNISILAESVKSTILHEATHLDFIKKYELKLLEDNTLINMIDKRRDKDLELFKFIYPVFDIPELSTRPNLRTIILQAICLPSDYLQQYEHFFHEGIAIIFQNLYEPINKDKFFVEYNEVKKALETNFNFYNNHSLKRIEGSKKAIAKLIILYRQREHGYELPKETKESLTFPDDAKLSGIAKTTYSLTSDFHRTGPHLVRTIFLANAENCISAVDKHKILLNLTPLSMLKLYIDSCKKLGIEPLIGWDEGFINIKKNYAKFIEKHNEFLEYTKNYVTKVESWEKSRHLV